MSQIGARIIILQVNTCDHESLLTNIKDYAKKKELGYVFTHDGVIQLDGRGRKIYLKQGVKTFERSLTLSGTPTRISRYAKLPDDFLVDVCGDTFDVSMFAGVSPEDVERYTAIHRAAVLRRAEKQTATARRNDMIMAATTSEQMLSSGLTSIEKLPSTLAGKELQEKILKEQKHVNPDLNGPVTYTFRHYVSSDSGASTTSAAAAATAPAVDATYPPVDVTIVGRPRTTDVKRKHWYIYSRHPGFGKSHTLAGTFADTYNVHVVSDIKNWTNVSRNAQFLVFDEVSSHRDRHLEFSQLKAFTGGSAKGAAGPRKSYGDSYVPRADVQIVMLGNHSPYEVYGEWKGDVQRRVMTTDRLRQFEERFVVIRLDGDVAVDRRAAMSPCEWTTDELNDEVRLLFVPPPEIYLRPNTRRQKVNRCLCMAEKALALFRAKHGRDYSDMFVDYLVGIIVCTSPKLYFPCGIDMRKIIRATIEPAAGTAHKRAKMLETYCDDYEDDNSDDAAEDDVDDEDDYETSFLKRIFPPATVPRGSRRRGRVERRVGRRPKI